MKNWSLIGLSTVYFMGAWFFFAIFAQISFHEEVSLDEAVSLAQATDDSATVRMLVYNTVRLACSETECGNISCNILATSAALGNGRYECRLNPLGCPPASELPLGGGEECLGSVECESVVKKEVE